MKFLALSPGHDPIDQGARHGDLTEWGLASEISDRVQEILAPNRIPILRVPKIPRANDSEPSSLKRAIAYRRHYAQDIVFGCDLHFNMAPGLPEACGTEIYVGEPAHSLTRSYATILLREVLASAGTRDRGVKNDTLSQHRRLGFCRDLLCPSAVLEIGFLSSEEDRRLTASPEGRRKVAEGIARAFLEIHGRG